MFRHILIAMLSLLSVNQCYGFVVPATSSRRSHGFTATATQIPAPNAPPTFRSLSSLLKSTIDSDMIKLKIHKDADAIFTVIDTNGNGSISLEEMTEHMTKAGYANDAVVNIFRKLDVNSDGGISQKEFRAGLAKFITLRAAPGFGDFNASFVTEMQQDSDHLFKTVDTDRSGSISRNELKEHVKRTNPSFSDAAIINIFDMLDINTDGEISKEELRESFVRCAALRQALGEGPNYK